ncbi:MAG: hypothetical protein ACLR5T_00560 [Veillonella sp.]
MVKWKDSSAACHSCFKRPLKHPQGDVIHGDIKQHDTTIVFTLVQNLLETNMSQMAAAFLAL